MSQRRVNSSNAYQLVILAPTPNPKLDWRDDGGMVNLNRPFSWLPSARRESTAPGTPEATDSSTLVTPEATDASTLVTPEATDPFALIGHPASLRSESSEAAGQRFAKNSARSAVRPSRSQRRA